MKKTLFQLTAAAAFALLASSSFAAVVYTSTSTVGLNASTATRPMVLDDITFAASTSGPQMLSAMTFGVGVLAGTTAQTGAVFVDFYDTFTPASTGSVVSDYIGGFSGTLTITANTGTATAFRAFTFSTLSTLATPIVFNDNNIAVVITLTDSTGSFYSTVMTPLMTTGAATVGSSITGVYRDLNSDGTFQAGELNATMGNLYLSMTTAPVPEPSSWALMGLGLIAGAAVARKRAA